jgi:type I restriction enzyme S subunit
MTSELNCSFKQIENNMIPESWEIRTLGEVLSGKGYIRGPFGSALRRPELKAKGIPVYEQEHAIYNRRKFRFYIDEDKLKELSRFLVKSNDLIVSCSGTLGKVSIISESDPKGIISQALLILRPSENRIVPKFLYYFLSSKKGFDSLVSRSSGSVQVNLAKREVIEEIPILLPPIWEQNEIVETLSNLDYKIQLNKQMNRALEAVGAAVFRRWFVDFEFPNQEGKPYKSSGGEMVSSEIGEIPKDWKISTISKLASSTNYGYTQSSSSTPVGPKFLRITDIQEGKIDWATVPYCEIEQDNSKYSLKSGDIVVARTGASTGENAYIEECPKSVFASYLIRIRFVDKNLALYVAKFMRSTRYRDYIESCIGGSAQPNANAITLTNIKVAVPFNDILQVFGSMAGIFELAKYRNIQESNTLALIRDLLLPKLMSGKIRVPVTKEEVEDIGYA